MVLHYSPQATRQDDQQHHIVVGLRHAFDGCMCLRARIFEEGGDETIPCSRQKTATAGDFCPRSISRRFLRVVHGPEVRLHPRSTVLLMFCFSFVQGQGGEDNLEDNLGRDISADFNSIQRRLATIESVLGVPGDSSSAERLGVEAGEGALSLQ